ncbi:MAG: PAS domain S-box protein, partial [Methanobacterium sp.]
MKTSDKFREIFENSPIGIIFHDKKGIIINANKSALEIMGVPKFEDIKGINLFDNPFIEENKENLLKKGIVRFQAPLDFDNIKEFGLYHPTKSGVVFLDYTVTITESGYLIQIQDITKRKYAEEALEESEEKFAKAFHSNSAAMTITRLNDGMIIDANESFKRLFGYNLDETVGHSTNELGIWLNSQERDDEVDQLLKQGNLPMHEVTFGTKSGEHINVMFSVELISISGQHFILSTIMDVNERKKAEEKLKESKILSDALNKINTNINSKLDYNEIMQSIVEEGAKAIGAESSVINIKERSNWIVKYVYNFPNSILGQIKSNEESPTSLYVANKKETVAFNDAQNDSRVNKNGMRLHGVASLLVAPIILRDEIKGIIAFYHHQKPFQFSEAHIDFANKLASSLSQALENAQLIDELQNAAEELEVSNEELRTTTEQLYASNDELQDTAKKLQKVNKELKESEKRYRSIIENVQDAYFRADKDGKIIIASP